MGAEPDGTTLDRVLGTAVHAYAPTLADMSPRMDELFLSALQELKASGVSAAR